jgi:hypothetical protein
MKGFLDLFINIEQKDDIRMHLMPTLGVAFGSIATEIGCPRDIRFRPKATVWRTFRIGGFVPTRDTRK